MGRKAGQKQQLSPLFARLYIGELLNQGVSISEIARIYKVHRNTVSKFINERL